MVIHDRQSQALGRKFEELVDIAFSPNGVLLLAADIEEGIRLWDSATGRLIGRIPLPVENLTIGTAFSPDGNWLYFGSDSEIEDEYVSVGRFDMNLRPLLTEACRMANRTLTETEILQYLDGISAIEHCSEL